MKTIWLLLLAAPWTAGLQDDKGTEARAALKKLAHSVRLYEAYTGQRLTRLTDLQTRGEGIEFWPDGGFLHGEMPKDPWGGEFRVTGRKLSCSRPGVTYGLFTASRTPIVPPTDRLKQFFMARIRIQLIRFLIQEKFDRLTRLPTRKEIGPLPRDPWGEDFELDFRKNCILIRVKKANRSIELTDEERTKLDGQSRVPLSESERKEIGSLLDQAVNDDLAVREEANDRILAFGDAARPLLRERIRTEKDSYGRLFLKKLDRIIPRSVPTWKSEVRPLVTAVSAVGEEQLRANERNANGSLKSCATAQVDFRQNDRDGNTINDFWVADVRGLYTIDSGGGAIKLIERPVAQADENPSRLSPGLPDGVKAQAKMGYHYGILKNFEDRTGEKQKYDRGNGRSLSRFGVVAYPEIYGVTGRRTFIISEQYTVFYKDTGGAKVDTFPDRPEKEGWRTLD